MKLILILSFVAVVTGFATVPANAEKTTYTAGPPASAACEDRDETGACL